MAQTCSLFSAPDGRVYRPRDCERLVLYLKDINLPRPDKYDTCMLIAFLQQLQTFGGFYDENLEFLRLERVHVSVFLFVCVFFIVIRSPPRSLSAQPVPSSVRTHRVPSYAVGRFPWSQANSPLKEYTKKGGGASEAALWAHGGTDRDSLFDAVAHIPPAH